MKAWYRSGKPAFGPSAARLATHIITSRVASVALAQITGGALLSSCGTLQMGDNANSSPTPEAIQRYHLTLEEMVWV